MILEFGAVRSLQKDGHGKPCPYGKRKESAGLRPSCLASSAKPAPFEKPQRLRHTKSSEPMRK